MEQMYDQVVLSVGPFLPKMAAALAILIVGWIIAVIASRLTAGVLRRTTLDNRLASWMSSDEKADPSGSGVQASQPTDVGRWVAKGVYYLVLLFVLVGVFQVLGLTMLTEPLNGMLNQVFAFAPRILGAGLLLLLAWAVATGIRLLVAKALSAVRLDQRLGQQTGAEGAQGVPLTRSIAEATYWLVFLLFLPAILGALALDGILRPLQEMLNTFLAFLPNVFAAAITLAIGWFLAKVVRQLVAGVLAATGLNGLADRVGVGKLFGQQRASGVVALIVYVLILIPTLIAALNALSLDAVTVPASSMLNTFMAAIPALFGAVLC